MASKPDHAWPLSVELERVSSSKPSQLELDVIGMFEEFRDALTRYVLSTRLSVHDAEEVIQEVFLALFQHLRQGKPRSNIKAWMFRVAHNLALKQHIRNGRHDRVHSSESGAEAVLDPQLDPEETIMDRQRRRQLLAAVETFPELDRCCLYLRAEGLRYREIADILGVSLGGVSLSLVRALSRLSDVDRKQL